MRISIIIPVYNEEKTIERIIQKVEKVLLPIDKEIIVVDDGSSDNTKKILNQLKNRFNFVLVEHKNNQGKGMAIQTGISYAKGDFILIQDADLEYSPKDYPSLLEPIIRGEADVIYGSRILRKNPYSSKFYYLGGRFLTFIFNLLYNTRLTDITTGYKIFKKEILTNLRLKEKGFSFCEEVTAKIVKKGYGIKEVPIHYTPRDLKRGKKIRWWRDGLKGLFVIIKNRFF